MSLPTKALRGWAIGDLECNNLADVDEDGAVIFRVESHCPSATATGNEIDLIDGIDASIRRSNVERLERLGVHHLDYSLLFHPAAS